MENEKKIYKTQGRAALLAYLKKRCFVARYFPCSPTNSKRIKNEIVLPCPKASCCAFGGADLNELFITTAGFYDTEEYTDAGKTFKTSLNTKGKTINYYKY